MKIIDKRVEQKTVKYETGETFELNGEAYLIVENDYGQVAIVKLSESSFYIYDDHDELKEYWEGKPTKLLESTLTIE